MHVYINASPLVYSREKAPINYLYCAGLVHMLLASFTHPRTSFRPLVTCNPVDTCNKNCPTC